MTQFNVEELFSIEEFNTDEWKGFPEMLRTEGKQGQKQPSAEPEQGNYTDRMSASLM
jgi:hypothetical protein